MPRWLSGSSIHFDCRTLNLECERRLQCPLAYEEWRTMESLGQVEAHRGKRRAADPMKNTFHSRSRQPSKNRAFDIMIETASPKLAGAQAGLEGETKRNNNNNNNNNMQVCEPKRAARNLLAHSLRKWCSLRMQH
ncbi:uncharacterized protein UBRO_06087 [Ustilago bromivora]|uniref:Uncharacterized protein n=1 Tax=Ustilago bromivora TaxID=307758 RepID=A0A1K0GA19_9BASI|nr:uncharacterized protein UBRO_06087 [Ustilago bromivora]